MSASPSRETVSSTKIIDGKNSFVGAAIKGSSLLNTVGDIRSFVQRGSSILIDDVAYEIAVSGEWNASSVQLTTDYCGETNFSVKIFIPAGSYSPKRKKAPGTTNSTKEVDMMQMVQGLDSITEMFGAKLKQQDMAQSSAATATGKHKRVSTKPKVSFTPAVDTVAENYAANPGKRNLPKKLPPLPAAGTETVDEDVVDDDSIDASREKVAKKPSRIGQPATKSHSVSIAAPVQEARPSSVKVAVPNSQAVSRQPNTSKPKDKPQPPTLSLPIKEKVQHSKITESSPVDVSNPLAAIVPAASVKSVEEERRAALLRVRQRNKEDQLLQEKAAATKELELKAQKEASANKAKELQARTALRVEQYFAEKQRKIENQKDLERYEEEQRQLKNQQFLNPSRHLKMKEIRKESNRRLQQLAYVDLVQAQVAEDHVQKSLFERHKKYDVNTTFLPRLDGALPQQGSTTSSTGTGQDSGVRVVRSIASELEQFEVNSTQFPEEQVLRSRSAKQAKRPGEAPRSGSLPLIAGAQKNTNFSAPAVRAGSNKHLTPRGKVQAPPRDEDEWSDDEPDPVQEAAIHAQANRRNDDGLDDDSLGGDEEDEGAVLERQIFGQAPAHAPVPHQRILGVQNSQAPSKPPTGKAKSKKSKRDVDDDASDCSDITIDSMLGDRSKAKNQTQSRVKTPVKSAVKAHNAAPPSVTPSGMLPNINLTAASARPSPYLPHQFGLPVQAPLPAQLHMQQQVSFVPRAPVGQAYHPQASNASSPSVSPIKPKQKNAFRKLKPIPISSQYQPVSTANY